MDANRASQLLDRQLVWISAADAKVGPILAMATAMLGVLAALVPEPTEWTILTALASAAAAVALLFALVALFLAAFPRTTGPLGSIIFFGGIVSKDIKAYEDALLTTADDELIRDLARQIHRNAEIADIKYRWVRRAGVSLFVSLLPWLLAVFTLYRHL